MGGWMWVEAGREGGGGDRERAYRRGSSCQCSRRVPSRRIAVSELDGDRRTPDVLSAAVRRSRARVPESSPQFRARSTRSATLLIGRRRCPSAVRARRAPGPVRTNASAERICRSDGLCIFGNRSWPVPIRAMIIPLQMIYYRDKTAELLKSESVHCPSSRSASLELAPPPPTHSPSSSRELEADLLDHLGRDVGRLALDSRERAAHSRLLCKRSNTTRESVSLAFLRRGACEARKRRTGGAAELRALLAVLVGDRLLGGVRGGVPVVAGRRERREVSQSTARGSSWDEEGAGMRGKTYAVHSAFQILQVVDRSGSCVAKQAGCQRQPLGRPGARQGPRSRQVGGRTYVDEAAVVGSGDERGGEADGGEEERLEGDHAGLGEECVVGV